jgi:hypothetical protein
VRLDELVNSKLSFCGIRVFKFYVACMFLSLML